jgi:hypothetical protein
METVRKAILALDESLYGQEDFSSAARYVCAPPLREKKEQEILWKALRHGDIQTVSTDHCSFTLEQKGLGLEDFTKIPGGLPGVEARGELMWSLGVARRKMSVARMCRVLSENPAKLYGLFPRKGTLQPGADADIVVYDPSGGHVIRAEDCESAAGYSPYEGFATDGGVRQVWLRGRLAVENGSAVTYTVPQRIRVEAAGKGVQVFFRVNRVFGKSAVTVTAGEKRIARFKREHMAPGEMERIFLPEGLLALAEGNVITVSAEEAEV